MQLSVQLYTLRELTEADFLGACSRVADVGFRFVELAGYGRLAPDALGRELASLGLGISGSHVGMDALDQVEEVIGAHKLFGCKNVVIPWVPEEVRVRAEDWVKTVDRFQAAAVEYRAAGMTLGFHNHDCDFQRMGDSTNWDYLFANAPDVCAEPDTHWVHKAGFDPASVIRGVSGRVPCVHFKDSLADGGMTEVGAGVLDWEGIIRACMESGVEYAVVEHDHPSDALESVRMSFMYLNGMLSSLKRQAPD